MVRGTETTKRQVAIRDALLAIGTLSIGFALLRFALWPADDFRILAFWPGLFVVGGSIGGLIGRLNQDTIGAVGKGVFLGGMTALAMPFIAAIGLVICLTLGLLR